MNSSTTRCAALLARRTGYELVPINGQQQERAAPWVRSA